MRSASSWRAPERAGAASRADDGASVSDHELAVEDEKLLNGDGGFDSARAGDIGIGKVEKAEQRGQVMAADRGVKRSALVGRCVEADGGPAYFRIEPPGDGQYRVAPGFDVQPAAVHPPEKDVRGILCETARIKPAALAVSRRRHYLAVQGFERPSRCDESASLPVEQIGVAGPFAQGTEVAGSFDEAPAEVVLPDSIDHHPCGQGIVFAGDGVSEIQAPAAPRERCLIATEHGQKAE